jgi:beta-lactamase class A
LPGDRIERIIDRAAGKVGVAVVGPENPDTLMFNGDDRFPMQSVYKFPLGLALLREVDRGTLSLDQPVHLTERDLLPDTWSPLRERYPAGDVTITLGEILAATVSESDNNGCDILFRLLGGPDAVQREIHGLGITDISIVSMEREMHADDSLQYRNWSTPRGMARLLSACFRDSVLSQKSSAHLWKLMAQSPTGPRRLRGQLPAGTVVAHKTGSSGTDERGIASATNDVGIIVLPDGRKVVVVVFITGSADSEAARDQVIAEIAKSVWDAHTKR